MSAINVLFYSNFCEGSKQLISILRNENLLRFFHLVCTDNNPNVPSQIKTTPTLIIRGVDTPFVAGDAFIWLARIKQWKTNLMIQKINTAQQQYLKSINNNLVSNEQNLLGFNELEMSAMSDIFSFFSRNINQECQDSLPQSYFSYSDLGKESIFTPPLEDGSYKINEQSKYKLDAAKQKELHTKLEIDRKKQDELIRQSIENFKKHYNGEKDSIY